MKQWRESQIRLRAAIERHESANQFYLDEGCRILELASKAYDMWLQQDQTGKRKLLDIILSNCTFDGENLSATYRKPFCWLAKGASRSDWLPGTPQNPNFLAFS